MDPGNDTKPENPQSWNKYAYVRNNPLKSIDPKGTNDVGVPTSQQQLDQMRATALTQQAAASPQAKAMSATAQLETATTAAKATSQTVCEAAPVVGEVYAHATTALIAAAPLTGGTSMPAAGEAGIVALGADAVAAICAPGPSTFARLGADLLGMRAAHATADVLESVPRVSPLIKAGAAEVTGELFGTEVQPPLQQSLTAICP